jgi:hypothetical protein
VALLCSEFGAALVAVVAGAEPILSQRAPAPARPGGSEMVRRAAVATLFGLHSIRFWIYLRPDQGRRAATG